MSSSMQKEYHAGKDQRWLFKNGLQLQQGFIPNLTIRAYILIIIVS